MTARKNKDRSTNSPPIDAAIASNAAAAATPRSPETVPTTTSPGRTSAPRHAKEPLRPAGRVQGPAEEPGRPSQGVGPCVVAVLSVPVTRLEPSLAADTTISVPATSHRQALVMPADGHAHRDAQARQGRGEAQHQALCTRT